MPGLPVAADIYPIRNLHERPVIHSSKYNQVRYELRMIALELSYFKYYKKPEKLEFVTAVNKGIELFKTRFEEALALFDKHAKKLRRRGDLIVIDVIVQSFNWQLDALYRQILFDMERVRTTEIA